MYKFSETLILNFLILYVWMAKQLLTRVLVREVESSNPKGRPYLHSVANGSPPL